MKKLLKVVLAIIVVVIVVYLLGPTPETPDYKLEMPVVPTQPDALMAYVQTQENAHHLKPNNEARIVWENDSLMHQTPYAIVYLHGFSASQEEGNPTHRDIARQFGCNLYLARLAAHGIDTSAPLANFSPEGLWETAKQALAIGRQLGKKVILMGTSTGGSVALQLAATYPDIAGLVLISPNIEINDANAWLLNNHWGKQIAHAVIGSEFRVVSDQRPIYRQYWNSRYSINAIVALQEYLETAMVPATFRQVKQPVLCLAYYKNEKEQDNVVRVDAMQKMFDQLGTSPALKKWVAMATTGNHVQGSPIKSNDVEGLKKEIAFYLHAVMKMPLQ